MGRMLLAACTVVSIAGVARAQTGRDSRTPTAPPVVLTGRVVADENGDPVPNARVGLTAGAADVRAALTDAEGRFTLSAPPGRHTLAARKAGYATREVTTTARATVVEIRLTRGAVITGHVVDQLGDPMMTARITVETQSSPASAARSVASAETDDRGEYRVASLPPGTFIVAVSTIGAVSAVRMDNSNAFAIVPKPFKVFYPTAASAAEGDPIHLQPGDERSGIDFRVPPEPLEVFPVGIGIARAQQETAGGAPGATAQTTSVIRGRVVSTDGRGVANARVQLLSATDISQSRSERADEEGRYEFRELARGRFQIVASKNGFSPAPTNPSVAAGPPTIGPGRAVEIAETETLDRIDITLAPWGAVEGRIFDENGDPIEGARAQVLALRYEAGRRRLVPAVLNARPTDDLGRYRVYGLRPGRYVITAAAGTVTSAELPDYGRSYYPGTPNAVEAQFVTVALAATLTGLDFSLARTRTARVAGTLLNAAGEQTMGGSLMLMPSARASSVASVAVGARISPDGAFEFPNVAPGQYVIQANRGRANSWTEGEFGSIPVAVNGADITGLVLQASAGSTISGRFTFDTADRSKLPAPTRLELSPIAVDPDVSPAQSVASANVHDNWTFDIAGINGPRRLQLVSAPEGWALKEIRVRGIDVTDRPLPFGTKTQSLTDVEVVLTDRINTFGGAVTDDRGRPAAGVFVLVFPTDRDRWYPASRYLRKTATDSHGAFSISGLPFANYYAVAAERLPDDGEEGWTDPEFLESLLSAASTLTLGEGERQVLNLRLKGR